MNCYINNLRGEMTIDILHENDKFSILKYQYATFFIIKKINKFNILRKICNFLTESSYNDARG